MISLQNYTTFSILSGYGTPEDWAEAADELGYDALGICDKQNMSGVIKFQKECKEREIKPIIGEEFLITDDCLVKDQDIGQNIQGCLLLYAKNKEGLENLVYLNNFSHDRDDGGFYYRPRIDMDIIKENSDGLICISPSEQGYKRDYDGRNNELKDRRGLYSLWKIFGDDFYLGINPLNPDHLGSNISVKGLDSMNKVFLFDAHYPKEKFGNLDKEKYKFDSFYDILRSCDNDRISKCKSRNVKNAYLPNSTEVRKSLIREQSEIRPIFGECYNNMQEVAEKCDAEFDIGEYKMPMPNIEGDSVEDDILDYLAKGIKKKLRPEYEIPENIESFDDIRSSIKEQGLLNEKPFKHINRGDVDADLHPISDYLDQLEYEFDIIEDLGYLEYFHMIREQCKYIDKKFPGGRGPARGSAAGALFSEILDIIKVDPERHDLIFERFLNPDRQDLPDIDLDFSRKAREEIIEYCKETWGRDSFCTIATYDRFKVKSAIKAVARAKNYAVPDNDGNLINYSIPKMDSITDTDVKATAEGWEELRLRREDSEEFDDFCKKHSDWIKNVVMPLQENIKNSGIHASGYLITRNPLSKEVPLYNKPEYGKVCQWGYRDAEDAGHPKFDFLSVNSVSIVNYAKELAERRHDVDIPSLEDVSLQDDDALSIFNKVETDGIFQFKSYPQQQYLPDLKPDKFEDLVASVALIRPGPMSQDSHLEYAEIKHGQREESYPHEDLKDILGGTHGLIVFQEQIMEIVRKIGGLTRAEADYVRKATGKKKREEMVKWEDEFKEGGLENGYDEKLLDNLWDAIVEFSEYGFNKAHATSYAILAYYQAYLKANYPLEFWCAALEYTEETSDYKDDPQDFKYKLKEDGIDILYPNINNFSPKFEPVEGEENTIVWPITAISKIGESIADEICKEGTRAYDSIEDMMQSTSSTVHKGIFKQLIRARFFDPVGPPWEVADKYFDLREKLDDRNDDPPPELFHRNEFRWYRTRNEVFDMIVEPWKKVAPFHKNIQYFPGERLKQLNDGTKVFIGGYVDDFEHEKTKYNDWYLKLRIIDDGEYHRVMVWSDFIEDNMDIMNNLWQGQLVELMGKKDSFKSYPQVTLGSPRCHFRIIWDEFSEDNLE